jgi:serine/threonine protein kinase/Tol biopolymer transport system component
MTDRWRRVEELCHAVLARPNEERTAFLAVASSGDDLLRRDVESLLAQESYTPGFLSTPAAASDWAALAQAGGTLVGKRLGSYSILSLLGVGGMGEVYRAHDERLGREVAIKVLPSAFTSDPGRRGRFEREARMLATLNHPNIGAIYGVEEVDGVRGLVLELVEGETLAERIADVRQARSGPLPASRSTRPPSATHRPGAPPQASMTATGSGLPITEVLAIARQIAAALDIAHEKGIVHRDLKPANIKITPDGVVKVLDFGLAKGAIADGSGPELTDSSEGVILGTAAYMSPEQARGQSIDKRGDIWAFGCVLYEMLTGRLAFSGETASDTIAKILEGEPDWSVLPSTTPAAVRRLLVRCLAKDPRQRLRDIGDASVEIDTIDQLAPVPVSGPAVAPPAVTATRAARLPWMALAALIAAIGGWEAVRRPATPPDNPLANARFSRFTDWEGTEGAAEISPDGRFVAFTADRDGEFDLWLSQVGTGRFLNLTKDIAPLDAPRSNRVLRGFGFSGDGADIWFSPGEVRAQRPSQGAPKTESKLIIPLLGGTPRPFLGESAETPSWSPDGGRLAFFTNGNGDPLLIAERTGADARPIAVVPPEGPNGIFQSGMHNHNPVWSPDGQWIYFVHGVKPFDEMEVWRVRPAGGMPEQLTDHHAFVNFLAPLDSRTLLYLLRTEDRSGPSLWALDIASKTTRRVSSGLEQYTSVSASRDGRRVVATVANPTASLSTVPIGSGPAEERDVLPYPLPTIRALGPRFAGTSLFYLSGRGTGDGLWRFQDGPPSEIWNGADGALSQPAAVSPDGRRVAIVLRHEGQRHLGIVAANGTDLRTLAASIDIQGAAGQGAADWSPDGMWIVTGGRDAEGAALFKIPVAGGEPVRLVAGQAVNPVWSPADNLIVYSGPVVAGQSKLLGVQPDGASVELPDVRIRQGGYRFMPDGKSLVFLPHTSALDFWRLDLTTKTISQLTRLENHGNLQTFDVTPDGQHIVFDRSLDNSDIVLIDLPK